MFTRCTWNCDCDPQDCINWVCCIPVSGGQEGQKFKITLHSHWGNPRSAWITGDLASEEEDGRNTIFSLTLIGCKLSCSHFQCTQTCGGGIKSRFVICQFPNGQMAQEQNCELPKPPSMMQCHVHACPGDVSWYRGPWKSVR